MYCLHFLYIRPVFFYVLCFVHLRGSCIKPITEHRVLMLIFGKCIVPSTVIYQNSLSFLLFMDSFINPSCMQRALCTGFVRPSDARFSLLPCLLIIHFIYRSLWSLHHSVNLLLPAALTTILPLSTDNVTGCPKINYNSLLSHYQCLCSPLATSLPLCMLCSLPDACVLIYSHSLPQSASFHWDYLYLLELTMFWRQSIYQDYGEMLILKNGTAAIFILHNLWIGHLAVLVVIYRVLVSHT